MHIGESKNTDYYFRNFDSDSKWVGSRAFRAVLCKEPKWMLTSDSMRPMAQRHNGTDEDEEVNGLSDSGGNTNYDLKTNTAALNCRLLASSRKAAKRGGAGVDGRDKAKEKVHHAALKKESLAAVKEMNSIMKGGHQSLVRKHHVDELKLLLSLAKAVVMTIFLRRQRAI